MASQRREDLALVKSEGKFRELMHAYLASIAFADALIGRLLDGLDSGPSADNTIVVLWSDHGWHFGEKEHLHKMTLWERATRVPFIISLPHNRNRSSICTAPVGRPNRRPRVVKEPSRHRRRIVVTVGVDSHHILKRRT